MGLLEQIKQSVQSAAGASSSGASSQPPAQLKEKTSPVPTVGSKIGPSAGRGAPPMRGRKTDSAAASNTAAAPQPQFQYPDFGQMYLANGGAGYGISGPAIYEGDTVYTEGMSAVVSDYKDEAEHDLAMKDAEDLCHRTEYDMYMKALNFSESQWNDAQKRIQSGDFSYEDAVKLMESLDNDILLYSGKKIKNDEELFKLGANRENAGQGLYGSFYFNQEMHDLSVQRRDYIAQNVAYFRQQDASRAKEKILDLESQINELSRQGQNISNQLNSAEQSAIFGPMYDYLGTDDTDWKGTAAQLGKELAKNVVKRKKLQAEKSALSGRLNNLVYGLDDPELTSLYEELKKLPSSSNNQGIVQQRNELHDKINNRCAELGVQPMDVTFGDTTADVVTGAALGVGMSLTNTLGTLGKAGAALGGTDDPYAGYDDMGLYSFDSSELDADADKIIKVADELGASSDLRRARATAGKSKAEKLLIDAGWAGTEMFFDAAVNVLTGGGGLATMAARVFGSSAREARLSGADLKHQIAYGAGHAIVETLTEKIGSIAGKIGYGSGLTDDVIERALINLADTEIGAKFWRIALSSGSEGLEEVISGILDPALQMIINEEARGKNYFSQLDPEELLHQGLVGSLLGLFGSVTGTVTGQTAGQDAEWHVNKATNKAAEIAEASLLNVGYDAKTAKKVSEATGKLAMLNSGELSGDGDSKYKLTDAEKALLDKYPTAREVASAITAQITQNGDSVIVSKTIADGVHAAIGKIVGKNKFDSDLRQGLIDRAADVGIPSGDSGTSTDKGPAKQVTENAKGYPFAELDSEENIESMLEDEEANGADQAAQYERQKRIKEIDELYAAGSMTETQAEEAKKSIDRDYEVAKLAGFPDQETTVESSDVNEDRGLAEEANYLNQKPPVQEQTQETETYTPIERANKVLDKELTDIENRHIRGEIDIREAEELRRKAAKKFYDATKKVDADGNQIENQENTSEAKPRIQKKPSVYYGPDFYDALKRVNDAFENKLINEEERDTAVRVLEEHYKWKQHDKQNADFYDTFGNIDQEEAPPSTSSDKSPELDAEIDQELTRRDLEIEEDEAGGKFTGLEAPQEENEKLTPELDAEIDEELTKRDLEIQEDEASRGTDSMDEPSEQNPQDAYREEIMLIEEARNADMISEEEAKTQKDEAKKRRDDAIKELARKRATEADESGSAPEGEITPDNTQDAVKPQENEQSEADIRNKWLDEVDEINNRFQRGEIDINKFYDLRDEATRRRDEAIEGLRSHQYSEETAESIDSAQSAGYYDDIDKEGGAINEETDKAAVFHGKRGYSTGVGAHRGIEKIFEGRTQPTSGTEESVQHGRFPRYWKEGQTPDFKGPRRRRLIRDYAEASDEYEAKGNIPIKRDQYPESARKIENWAMKVSGSFVSLYDGRNASDDQLGFMRIRSDGTDNLGVFANYGYGGNKSTGESVVHEVTHIKIISYRNKYQKEFSSKPNFFQHALLTAMHNSGMPTEEYVRLGREMQIDRAYTYLKSYVPEFDLDAFSALESDEDRIAAIDQVFVSHPSEVIQFWDICAEEEFCNGIGRCYDYFDDLELAARFSDELRKVAINLKIFDESDFWFDGISIDNLISDLNSDLSKMFPIEEITLNQETNTTNPTTDQKIDALLTQVQQLTEQIAQLQGQQSETSETASDEVYVQPHSKKAKSQNAAIEATSTEKQVDFLKEKAGELSKKYGVGDLTHQSMTHKEVTKAARHNIDKYCPIDPKTGKRDFSHELNRLLPEYRDEEFVQKNWSRVDKTEASLIIDMMTEDALERQGQGPLAKIKKAPGESVADFRIRREQAEQEAYEELMKPIQLLELELSAHDTGAGGYLQESPDYTIAERVMMQARKALLNWGENGKVFDSKNGKAFKVYKITKELSKMIDAAENANGGKGDKAAIIDIAKKISYIRGLQNNLWGQKGVQAEAKLLESLSEKMTAEELATLTYSHLKRMLDDLHPISMIDALSSYRMMNMLSGPATAVNNWLNNDVNLSMTARAHNNAVARTFANMFEKITGEQFYFKDYSGKHKGNWGAEIQAYQLATLMSYYGIKDNSGKFEIFQKNSFNPNYNMYHRWLAAYSFLVNEAVMNPDAMAVARVRHGMTKGLNETADAIIKKRGLTGEEADAFREQYIGQMTKYVEGEANYRTFKNDNKVTGAFIHLKNLLNEIAHIGNEKSGQIGLGDILMAFTKVPVNVAQQAVGASPIGGIYHLLHAVHGYVQAKQMHADVMNGVEGAKEMSKSDMMKYSREAGQAANSFGLALIGALAALTGGLRNIGDDDDDPMEKRLKEMGISGYSWNISRTFNPLRWGNYNDWNTDDVILSTDFMEVFALPMSVGALAAESYVDGMNPADVASILGEASIKNVFMVIQDMPGLESFATLSEAFNDPYTEDGEIGEKLAAAAMQYIGNSASSFVMPNALTQLSQGTSNTVKDTRSDDGLSAWKLFASRIPLLRNTLPDRKDSHGAVKNYGPNRIMSIMNKVFLPGDIRVVKFDEVDEEIGRLAEQGYTGIVPETSRFIADLKNESGEKFEPTIAQRRDLEDGYVSRLMENYIGFLRSDAYKTLDDAGRTAVFNALRTNTKHVSTQETYNALDIGNEVSFEKWETELKTPDERYDFLAAKDIVSGLLDDDKHVVDSKKMDAFIRNTYASLNDTQKDLLDNSFPHLDDIFDASSVGIDSRQWQTAYNIFKKYQDSGDKTAVASAEMWNEMKQGTEVSSEQLDWFRENMKILTTHATNTAKVDKLYAADLSSEESEIVMSGYSGLEAQKGYSEIQIPQEWNMLASIGLSDSKQWAVYEQWVPKSSSYDNKRKRMQVCKDRGLSFKQAIHETGWDVVYWKDENGRYPVQ